MKIIGTRVVADRIEQAKIELGLDARAWDDPSVREWVNVLTEGRWINRRFGKRDTLSLSYNFTIAYDEVVAPFRALIGLMERTDVWVDASLWEQNGGSLLVVELVDALRGVQRAIAERAA